MGGNMRDIISGVYKITNKTNGHSYIGSSVDIHERWVTHRWYLNLHKSHNIAFQRAWEKYGEESFDFSILLICDKENTTMYEQIYLDYYKPEYNIAIDALCPNKGMKLSEEHKRKIGETNSKHKMSDEQKEFLRQFHAGIPLSEEHKRKISEGNKGKHPVGTFKKGNVPWNKGIKNPFSEETTEKLRKAATGRKHTEEAKTKIGLASVERGRKNKLKKIQIFDESQKETEL